MQYFFLDFGVKKIMYTALTLKESLGIGSL